MNVVVDSNIKEYIDSKLGLIKEFNRSDLGIIEKKSVSIAGVVLEVNDKTTLNGFFSAEVIYLGEHKGYMQFQIGEDDDLFGSCVITNEFKKIDENRIMTIHQLGTARDYNFINGRWK